MTHRIQLRLLTPLAVAALLLPNVTTAAAAPTQLTISYAQKTVDFLPLQIAADAGYFKKHNLDVTLRYLPAQEGIPALIGGQTQVAAIGGADASSAEAAGAKLKLVLTLSPVYTFQFWARPQYASANALKGQRVGITSTTGSLYAGTVLALKELGLTTSDVSITPLGGVTNVNSSLLAGSIAAAASHPPATYEFEKKGFVDLVDLAKKSLPSVSAGVWFTQSYLDAHRDVVQNVVDSVMEALKREKSDRAYTESEISKHLGVKNKDELDFTYDFYIKEVLTPGPMPKAAAIEANIKPLLATNPKVKNLDAAAMIDQRFIKAFMKQEGTDENAMTSGANASSH
jgi:NitT/TauT family transport system substrate-binding protein